MTDAKNIRAILIDPWAYMEVSPGTFVQTGPMVEEITFTRLDPNEIDWIYKALSTENFPCHNFDLIRLDFGDGIYIDDNGRLPGQQAFAVDKQIDVCGRGLILGSDQHGNTTDCKISVEEVKKRVSFLGKLQEAKPTQEMNGTEVRV